MLGWLTGNWRRGRSGQQLYECIVAQARTPDLYTECGVADTMVGRFEMVLLHTVLALDRLRSEGSEGQWLGQALMERLVADMDDALRQIGLGDDSVTMRMKRVAGALGERARDYGSALQKPELDVIAALAQALATHVHGAGGDGTDKAPPAASNRLAHYVVNVRTALARVPSSDVLAGRLTFPAMVGSMSIEEGSGT